MATMEQTLPENKDTPSIIAWHEVILRIEEETLFAKISALFLRDSRRRMESLCRAIENHDTEAVQFLAHTLKGSAAMLAAHRLAAAAKDLECAATSHATDVFTRLYHTLQDEYTQVHAVLSNPGWHDAYQRHRRTLMSH